MKLFCRRYGEGPPLVILHGLYGSSDNWMTIARNISSHYTVYLPDQRNHGKSPHDDLHDYQSMSNDLFELVTEYKLGSFFLAGHSMGGKTAVNFALKWPGMINGLAIFDISPFTDYDSLSASRNQHKNILSVILETDIASAKSRKEIEELLSASIPSEKERKVIMKNIQRDADKRFSWKLNAQSLLKNLDMILEGINRQAIDDLRVTGLPVIFLKGEKSDYLNPEDYSYIMRLFPAAEFRVIRNAGHWLHVDNPEAVTETLIGLLY